MCGVLLHKLLPIHYSIPTCCCLAEKSDLPDRFVLGEAGGEDDSQQAGRDEPPHDGPVVPVQGVHHAPPRPANLQINSK